MCPGECFGGLTCLFLYFDCSKPLIGFLKLPFVPGTQKQPPGSLFSVLVLHILICP